MSKKSILSIIFALIITFSFGLGTYAEKEQPKEDNQKQTESKSSKSEESKKDSNKEKDQEEDNSQKLPELHSDYYLLGDLDTGKILHSKNADQKVYPASTTKILTALITLERLSLTEVVTASQEAISPINHNHSNMGILAGEQLTVEQLLYGLLVHSANDAANVLAVHISGSLEEFAVLMNQRAKELGATNTNFTNAHGFHDDNHYTTAEDLAKMAAFAMKNETFANLVSTVKYQIPPTNKYKDIRYFSNTNMMLSANKTRHHLYSACIGIKTGSTDESGNCLVSAAEKNGTRLLAVVMKCKNEGVNEGAYSFTDSRALFDYGFENYKHITIASKDDVVESSKVREAKDSKRVSLSPLDELRVLLPKTTDLASIKAEATKNDTIKAPIKKGDILGEVTYSLNGEILGTTKLVAINDVERDIFLHIIFTFVDIISDPVVIVAVILLIFVILYARAVQRKKRRKRRRQLRSFNFDDDFDDYPRKRR